MEYIVKITESDLDQLRQLLWGEPGKESVAFLLAGIHELGGRLSLLVRRVVEVPPGAYRVRTRSRIELRTSAINGLAALCEANNLTAILAHSHPDHAPYSPSDDHGEDRVARALRPFLPRGEVGSLLFTPERIYGRIWRGKGEAPEQVAALTVIGRSVRRISLENDELGQTVDEVHARQVLAFGEAGQETIARLRVGIVGSGGTGSPLAEQLVRLGVRDLLIVDRDVFESSNLSRVYGSHWKDAHPSFWRRLLRRKNWKVDIVADHLRRIAPEARISAIQGDVTVRKVASKLLDRDVLFACTDEHWGRSILNQIAYQYLIPTLNLGVAITSDGSEIENGVGVVQILRPDHGCLWCCGFLRSERIRAESLEPEERKALEGEGYLVGIDEAAPSVVTLTSTVAGLAGTWFVQLATDFMGRAGELSRQNYDLLSGTVRRGHIPPGRDCICTKVKAKGDCANLPLLAK